MKLGQHFLINKNKLKKFIDALNLKNGDVVIEIGAGHGEITDELRIKNNGLRVIAIEKDKNLARDLRSKIYDLRSDKEIEIIEGDALKILKSYILNIKSYKLAGNIPFYLTGYLFRILGELENRPSLIVLIIQKEVAERIVAKPPQMNLLAASVQFWAEPKIIDSISKNDFKPRPKVDSAIIKFNVKTSDVRRTSDVQKLKYYKLISILFKQPRKTVWNNVKTKISLQKLQKAGVNPNDRPQNLSIEQIIKLSTLF